MANSGQSFDFSFLLFDAGLSEETLNTLRRHAPQQWYAGEADPSFMRKIPELRNHALSTERHRDEMHPHLQSYGAMDESVFVDEDEDEKSTEEVSKACRSLALLMPHGEVSLAFAGPCVSLVGSASLESDTGLEQLLREVNRIQTAFGSKREYRIIEQRNPGKWLTWDELKESIVAAHKHAADAATRAGNKARRESYAFGRSMPQSRLH